jgi:hypothetical protein
MKIAKDQPHLRVRAGVRLTAGGKAQRLTWRTFSDRPSLAWQTSLPGTALPGAHPSGLRLGHSPEVLITVSQSVSPSKVPDSRAANNGAMTRTTCASRKDGHHNGKRYPFYNGIKGKRLPRLGQQRHAKSPSLVHRSSPDAGLPAQCVVLARGIRGSSLPTSSSSAADSPQPSPPLRRSHVITTPPFMFHARRRAGLCLAPTALRPAARWWVLFCCISSRPQPPDQLPAQFS